MREVIDQELNAVSGGQGNGGMTEADPAIAIKSVPGTPGIWTGPIGEDYPETAPPPAAEADPT